MLFNFIHFSGTWSVIHFCCICYLYQFHRHFFYIHAYIYCKVQVLKPIEELWAFYIWLAVSWLQQCFIWWNTAMLVGGDRSVLHRKWTSSGDVPSKITEFFKMRKIFKNLLKISSFESKTGKACVTNVVSPFLI